MAGVAVSQYSSLSVNLNALMETVDVERRGYQAVSLTEMGTTNQPSIASGSAIEVAGTLYRFASDNSILSAPTGSGMFYIVIKKSVDGLTCTAEFTSIAPTWSDAKQGWYGTGTGASWRYLDYDIPYTHAGTLFYKNQNDRKTPKIFHIIDSKANTTAGGTFTAPQTYRSFNTTVYNGISGASVNVSDIILPAGTYRASVTAPGFDTGGCSIILITGSTILGRGGYNSNAGVQVNSVLECVFTHTGLNTIYVLQFGASTKTTTGLGVALSNGNPEIYTQAIFEKIA